MGISEQEWNNFWNQRIKTVPGWLNCWEGQRLMNLAEMAALIGPVVEIGMYKGRSTLCLAEGIRRALKGHIWTIDLFEETYTFEGCSSPLPSLSQSRQTLAENSALDLVTIINGDSRLPSTANQVPNEIALLFVDGDHTLEALKKEWEVWSPKLRKDGWIVVHDYQNESVGDGVTKFCDDLLRGQFFQVEVCYKFKKVADSIPGGLFIGKGFKGNS